VDLFLNRSPLKRGRERSESPANDQPRPELKRGGSAAENGAAGQQQVSGIYCSRATGGNDR
jgi:hypothetical protein